MSPQASVIVRSRDKVATIGRTLDSIRRQSVASEIIVVDSGSTDGTLVIAEQYADKVIRISPSKFTYGGALNIGAEAATSAYHFALSAHAVPFSADWIKDSLALYARQDVAGTNGATRKADGAALDTVHYQTAQDVVLNAGWGFSNHGSSWRASVWRDYPFREDLPANEDKEWSWRVLADGWTIGYSPLLQVSSNHRRDAGIVALGKRVLKERGTLAAMGAVEPKSLGAALSEWWHPEPVPGARAVMLRRLSPWRMVEIACAYAADTQTRPPISAPGLQSIRDRLGQVPRSG